MARPARGSGGGRPGSRNRPRGQVLTGPGKAPAAPFDVGKFAQARYRAEGFRKLDDGRYAADGTLELRGVRKPVTLTFSWTPGAAPVLQGKATVKRLDFGVGGGDWADTKAIPDEVAISTRVVFKPL